MADNKHFLKDELELVSENMAVSSFKNKYDNYLNKKKEYQMRITTNPELRGNEPGRIIRPIPTREQSINK